MKTIAITRETSKYNKNMKWHLIVEQGENQPCSEFYKTEREALNRKERIEQLDEEKYTTERVLQ